MPNSNAWVAIAAAAMLGILLGASVVAIAGSVQPSGWAEVLAISAFTAVGLVATGAITFAAAERSAAPARDQAFVAMIAMHDRMNDDIEGARARIATADGALALAIQKIRKKEEIMETHILSENQILIPSKIAGFLSKRSDGLEVFLSLTMPHPVKS